MTMQHVIKNLLFDLGGVIMEIRRQNCIEAFHKLGMKNPEEFLGEYVQAGPFMGIENGSMTPDDFHNTLRPYLRPGVTDAEIDEAFNKFLIGIPEYRLDELKKLKKAGFGIYMLSNTNPIMWHSKIAAEFRKQGLDGPESYFDGIVTSFRAKVMKPQKGIFDYAQEQLGIRPEETIFLDDSQANLDAASKLGYETLLVTPGAEFSALLATKGINI